MEMTIDENKEEFDLSDHHLITVKLKISNKSQKKGNNKKWITRVYLTEDENALAVFRGKLEGYWKNNKIETISEMNHSIRDIAKQTLLNIELLHPNNN